MTEIIEVKRKVSFSELTWGCKVGIIGGWVIGVLYTIMFMVGVIEAMLGVV